MKKRVLGFMALLLLVGISTKYVGSTFAKYTGSVAKTSTAKVAKWAFATDNSDSTGALTISLPATVDPTTLVANRIAPGTSGTFDIVIANTHSEVGIDYEVSWGALTNVPANLILKEHEGATLDTSKKFVGKVVAGGSDTIKIDWEWPYGVDSFTSDTEDAEDNTDGIAAKDVTITANVVAKQTGPGAAITTGHTANN